MIDFFKRSIRRQFFLMMSVVFIVGFLGTTFLYASQKDNQAEHLVQTGQLLDRQALLSSIDSNLASMLMHSRGYIAFNEPTELDIARQYGNNLENQLNSLETKPFANDMRPLIQKLRAFLDVFWDEKIPEVVAIVETGDYEQIQDMQTAQSSATVAELFTLIQAGETETEELRSANTESFLGMLDRTLFSLFALLFLIFVVLLIASRSLSSRIGRPIISLTEASQALANDQSIQLLPKDTKRTDEIGVLSRSFYHMSEKVQERLEHWNVQNEELRAQQETLSDYVKDLRHLTTALHQSSMVVELDQNGQIQNVNANFSEVSSFSAEELENTPFINLVTPNEIDDIRDYFSTTREGRVWNGELSCIGKHGGIFYADTTIVPYMDANKITQYVVIQKNNTERKQAQQQLQKSLQETEAARTTIDHYNQMNHALSVGVDKKTLLTSVLSRLGTLYSFTYGVLFLTNGDEYATLGAGHWDSVDMLKQSYTTHVLRLEQTRQPFTLTRPAHASETGHLPSNETTSEELYVPVLSSNGQLLGGLILTRVGDSFSTALQEELFDVMKRLSLSIERIEIFYEMEHSRQLNQNILDTIDEGIILLDADGGLLQCNRRWLSLFQIEEHEPKRWRFDDWVHRIGQLTNEKESFHSFCEAIISSSTTDKAFQLTLGDQDTVRVITVYTVHITLHSQAEGVLFVFRDMTSQHEINQMKSDLVSTVSHELRTPLASVLGYTELMIHKDLPVERQQKYLKTIHGEAERLTHLINDFLDLQRMESGLENYRKEHLALSPVIEELVETFQLQSTEHHWHIVNSATKDTIYMDREKMIQLFTNLLGNAKKFSPDGGEVTIALSNDEHQLFTQISDEGIGIPEQEVPKLFSKFHRIDNSSQRKIGGTGLGLAICKEIVEAHHGMISVQSIVGEGSVFTIAIPFEKITRKVAPEDAPRIVLLEDDASLAALLGDELMDTGFSILHYQGGRQLLEELESVDASAFVIDLTLADDTSGWDIVQKIKENHRLADVPIFISSAAEKTAETDTLGITDYLVKPYPPHKLSMLLLQTLLHEKKKGQIFIAQAKNASLPQGDDHS